MQDVAAIGGRATRMRARSAARPSEHPARRWPVSLGAAQLDRDGLRVGRRSVAAARSRLCRNPARDHADRSGARIRTSRRHRSPRREAVQRAADVRRFAAARRLRHGARDCDGARGKCRARLAAQHEPTAGCRCGCERGRRPLRFRRNAVRAALGLSAVVRRWQAEAQQAKTLRHCQHRCRSRSRDWSRSCSQNHRQTGPPT